MNLKSNIDLLKIAAEHTITVFKHFFIRY